jgi:hypothetical protein
MALDTTDDSWGTSPNMGTSIRLAFAKKGISWSVGNSNLDGKQTPTVSYLWNDHPFASHFGVHFGWVLTTEALKTNSPLQGPSLPPAGCPEIMVFWRKWGQCLISYWKIRKSDNKTIRKSQEITILKLVFLSVACIRMSEDSLGRPASWLGMLGLQDSDRGAQWLHTQPS